MLSRPPLCYRATGDHIDTVYTTLSGAIHCMKYPLFSNNAVQVKCILVNIFGGIVNCETIANGIIKACQDLDLTLPLIVRLEGE